MSDIVAQEMPKEMVDHAVSKIDRALEIEKGEEQITFWKLMKQSQDRRALLASIPALTLGIMGGAVLPVAWAFSVTGIICGVLIMVVVALANTYTCDLLLKQAYFTRTYDYETLSLAVGGRQWKLVTEVSIVVLLLGSMVGQTAQIGEVGRIGLLSIWPRLPDWFVNSDGRLIMAVGMLLVVAPLCSGKQLSQLEYAGLVGTTIVLWLVLSVVTKSISENLPALRNKEFPVVGFNSIGDVTQAASIFGFAFYAQPIMMPLLAEVPDGIIGVKIVSYSIRIVVLINAFLIYFFIGFFGAALYGQATASDILENKWLGGGIPQGILNLSMTGHEILIASLFAGIFSYLFLENMYLHPLETLKPRLSRQLFGFHDAVYLCISIPAVEFPTRHTIDGWLPQGFMQHSKLHRQLTITAAILTFVLALALAFPNSSGNVLVVTGATGVCMVSYLIPVVNHFLLFYNRAKIQNGSVLGEELATMPTDMEINQTVNNHAFRPSAYTRPQDPGVGAELMNLLKNILMPGIVLAVGVFCSIAALTTL